MKKTAQIETGLTDAIVGFAQFARRRGLNAGMEETFSALKTFDLGLFSDMPVFYYSLKSLFCTRREDIPLFDELFKIYWLSEEDNVRRRSEQKISGIQNIPQRHNSLMFWGMKNKEERDAEEYDSRTTTGANTVARLQKTDFSRVSEMDATLLETLAEKLWREMLRRLRRRRKKNARRGQVDLRRTLRASLQQGGEPVYLRFKNKKPRKLRLVLLLDVSGSMDKYSFFLLRFVWALQSHFEQVESFIFSTRLHRITELLKTGGLEKTLRLLSERTEDWSSGTRIGECLKTFNEEYARHILARSACTIVLSDGLDTGEAGVLASEVQKLRRRTKRLVWLNPLKGTAGYAPTARGMSEALPFVDHFHAAHNLESLMELEELLASI
ncbi:MAG: VWA domain-containing protein [Haliscomenobacteraceae bacterium CHB4]|nr:VWA domain-containing protein [Haliscomenobacteraceae bacterium CHB4]